MLDEAESIILGDELSVSGINSVLRRIMEQNSSEADSSVITDESKLARLEDVLTDG